MPCFQQQFDIKSESLLLHLLKDGEHRLSNKGFASTLGIQQFEMSYGPDKNPEETTKARPHEPLSHSNSGLFMMPGSTGEIGSSVESGEQADQHLWSCRKIDTEKCDSISSRSEDSLPHCSTFSAMFTQVLQPNARINTQPVLKSTLWLIATTVTDEDQLTLVRRVQ